MLIELSQLILNGETKPTLSTHSPAGLGVGANGSTERTAGGCYAPNPNQALTVRYDQPYTSALLYVADGQSLSATYLIVDGDTLPLRPEPHALAGQAMSALCVSRHPVTSLSLQTGTLSGAVTLLTLYASPLPAEPVAGDVLCAAYSQQPRPGTIRPARRAGAEVAGNRCLYRRQSMANHDRSSVDRAVLASVFGWNCYHNQGRVAKSGVNLSG